MDTWKKIAFRCIEMDGFCSFPQCGSHLLEDNAKSMAACVQEGSIPYKKPATVQNPKQRYIYFDESYLLGCIGFATSRDMAGLPSQPDANIDGFLSAGRTKTTSCPKELIYLC